MVVPPHHVLMWSGDVPHSGASYEALNVRSFAYVDQKEHARVPDTTYPLRRLRRAAKRKHVA